MERCAKLHPGHRRRSAKRSNAKAEAAPPANKARSARPGSTVILNELADEGFFDERRLLKDIVEHAKSQNARKFFTATAT
jgi:hypothetical protein